MVTGFGNIKAWTKEEQKEAIENQKFIDEQYEKAMGKESVKERDKVGTDTSVPDFVSSFTCYNYLINIRPKPLSLYLQALLYRKHI